MARRDDIDRSMDRVEREVARERADTTNLKRHPGR
jgi:hypothetical protein